MPSTDYFRRQADVYLRLSLLCDDDKTAKQLLAKAVEYQRLAVQKPADEETGPHTAVIPKP